LQETAEKSQSKQDVNLCVCKYVDLKVKLLGNGAANFPRALVQDNNYIISLISGLQI